MTKDEMLEKYYGLDNETNYKEAQDRIKEAMQQGENYVYLPKESCKSEFTWWVLDKTIDRLREDGFDINQIWDPDEYWSVEW